MQLNSFTYQPNAGWSCHEFPKLSGSNDLLMVFAAPEIYADPTPLAPLLAAYPDAYVLGCSADKAIYQGRTYQHAMTAAVISFATTRLEQAVCRVVDKQEAYQAGFTIAKQLNHPDLKQILILADGATIDASELMAGLRECVDDRVQIYGGLASGSEDFAKAWVIDYKTPCSGFVSAIGFYGPSVQFIDSGQAETMANLDKEPSLALTLQAFPEPNAKQNLAELYSTLPSSCCQMGFIGPGWLGSLSLSQLEQGSQGLQQVLIREQ